MTREAIEPILLSRKIAGKLLGISVGMLDKLRRQGRIEDVRIGKRVMFRRDSIEELARTPMQRRIVHIPPIMPIVDMASVRFHRLCQGITLADVCQITGISTARLSEAERGCVQLDANEQNRLKDYFRLKLDKDVGPKREEDQP